MAPTNWIDLNQRISLTTILSSLTVVVLLWWLITDVAAAL